MDFSLKLICTSGSVVKVCAVCSERLWLYFWTDVNDVSSIAVVSFVLDRKLKAKKNGIKVLNCCPVTLNL